MVRTMPNSNFDPIAHGYKRVLPPDGSQLVGIQGKSLHPSQFGRMVSNIEHGVTSAGESRQEGLEWYSKAHDVANTLGKGDTKMGAGVLAAISAQKPWISNVRLAKQAFSTGTVSNAEVTGQVIKKVRRILDGEDPEEVLPMTKKTGHFYRNILDPSDPHFVTIDRHAHDSAVGRVLGNDERGLHQPGRYKTFVNAHIQAANNLGLVPSQVQAVSWVNWLDLKNK